MNVQSRASILEQAKRIVGVSTTQHDGRELGTENYRLLEDPLYYRTRGSEDRMCLLDGADQNLLDLSEIGFIYSSHTAIAIALLPGGVLVTPTLVGFEPKVIVL